MSGIQTAHAWSVLGLVLLVSCGGAPVDVHLHASRIASQVRAGAITDCEALARFAESVKASDAAELVSAFNVFIPRAKANYPLGRPIALVGSENPIKLEGSASGYRAEFRKGYEPGRLEGTAHDQAHHFAPYLILGARVPQSVAMRFLERAERSESWGDLNLAREAIELGAALDEGTMAPKELGAEIRRRLCLDGPLGSSRR